MSSAENSDEENALQLELYYKYLQAQAQGYDGDLESYVSQEIAQPIIDSIMPEDEANEEVQTTSSGLCKTVSCKTSSGSNKAVVNPSMTSVHQSC